MSMDKKRSRARAGGKAARSTNRWYYLRLVTGYDKHGQEVLECGHAQRARSDMIGEYDATRHRCRQCPKPTLPCPQCDGSGTAPGPRDVPHRCSACNGDGKILAKQAALPGDWFNALGHPTSDAGRRAALDLLVAEGLPEEEACLVVPLVAREIEHDNPERAQKILRNWLPPHGSEILLFQTLAVMCTTPHLVPA